MESLLEAVKEALDEIFLCVSVDGELEEARLLLENVLQRMYRLHPLMSDSEHYVVLIVCAI